MLSFWLSSVVFIPIALKKPHTIITKENCYRKINEMHQELTRKQPALVKRKGPLFLHDNTTPHFSMITRQKLHTLNYEVLDHPLCSPDISPTDFPFFKHLDNLLQEKCFRNPKNVETAYNFFFLPGRLLFMIPA